jgi:hypothetical protein
MNEILDPVQNEPIAGQEAEQPVVDQVEDHSEHSIVEAEGHPAADAIESVYESTESNADDNL